MSPPSPKDRQLAHVPYDLTKCAKPGASVKSYDGLCGNIIKDVLITSPNMRILYEPPLNECRVRLRRDRHFGRDDPLYYPQPFSRRAPHLSVIRVPLPSKSDASQDPFSVAWVVPNEQHFVSACGSFCQGFGTLQDTLSSQLADLGDNVIGAMPQGYNGDVYLRTYSSHLRATILRLQVAAPMADVLLRFRCAQRYILELDARIRWLEKYHKSFEDVQTKNLNCYERGDSSLMGAFTDELDVVESLYRSGIPVYFLRPFRGVDVRVDEVVPIIQGYSDDPVSGEPTKIRLHTGAIVDISDATPSHRVVFIGLPRNPERYVAMGRYMVTGIEYPSLMGSDQPRSSTSLQMINVNPRMSTKPGMSLRHASSKGSRNRQAPYSAEKKGRQKHHSSFLPPSSPLSPASIDAWRDALARLSDYNQSLPPPDGINRGYVLPPPEMFVTTSNPSTATALFRNWLRLRQVLIYRLSVTSDRYSKKQWRDMLTFDEVTQMRPETRTGQRRLEAMDQLKAMVDATPLKFRVEDIPSTPVFWRGRRLEPSRIPPPVYAKEILWELNELNFRQDLVVLDHHLNRSRMDIIQRTALLDACWTGSRDFADIAKAQEGFGAVEAEHKVRYLRALHSLMMGWTDPKPVILFTPFPVTDVNGHNFEILLQEIERELAHHYALSFLEVFGRAASIPHRLE
ncbi:hypothetical protein VNI00_007043 [Paramarasmius palmivorus]|uniref:Uncharacterized protein n=1 Tax=Paramarasmius palmivorus TaxID=297713 RepID=A0AAW0D2Z2_9AGAR